MTTTATTESRPVPTKPAPKRTAAKTTAPKPAAKKPAAKPDFKPSTTGGDTVTDLLAKGATAEAVKKVAGKKVAASKEPEKAPAKKAAPKPQPDPALTARIQAARQAGFTCRAIAVLVIGEIDTSDRSHPAMRLAGNLDAVSAGRAPREAADPRVAAVLGQIESGKISPPERATAARKPSNRAAAVHALEAATAEKSIAGKQKLIDEALRLLAPAAK
jgi:hypothetical protein